MNFKVFNPDEWRHVAKNVAELLKHPLLLLSGDLGAGKTTFTQYLLQELGSTDTVCSPTYALVNEYDANGKSVYHFDLYRLNDEAEVDNIGMEEYLNSGNLCIIEWPEVYMSELSYYPHHSISLKSTGNYRDVVFQ